MNRGILAMKHTKFTSVFVFAFLGPAMGLATKPAAAQAPEQQQTQQPAAPPAADSQAAAGPPTAAPTTITLQDALARARNNTPQFRAALSSLGVSHEDTVQ